MAAWTTKGTSSPVAVAAVWFWGLCEAQVREGLLMSPSGSKILPVLFNAHDLFRDAVS
jgi:hypothetical protein